MIRLDWPISVKERKQGIARLTKGQKYLKQERVFCETQWG
jgi:hypothetical protein